MYLLWVFILVSVVGFFLCNLAPKVGLLALPGDHRTHSQPTPMVGGIAMFIGISAWLLWTGSEGLKLLPSLTLLCIVGVIDDKFGLPSWFRFLAQGVAAYLMIKFTGAQLGSLGDIIFSGELLLNQWSIPFTIFAVIGVINAINMSDGMDGLAGSLVALLLIVLIVLGIPSNDLVQVTLAAVLGFLLWNVRLFRPRAKIFMGDAGSTMLGLLIAYFLIQASQQPISLVLPVTALWLLALPLIDTVALLMLRPLRGSSPFSADQTHYHHIIRSKGFGVNGALIIAMLIQLSFTALGLTALNYGISETAQLALFLLCFSGYFLYLWQLTKPSV